MMPAQKLARGLVIVFLLFLICILIRPAGLAANSGLSYYGSFKTTLLPYSLGFVAFALTYWEAGRLITAKPSRPLRTALQVMAALFIGLLITPHTIIDPLHKIVGISLFVAQLLTAFWLVYQDPKDRLDLVLAFTLLISGVAADLNLAGNEGFLIQTQFAFQLFFNTLLYRSLLKLQHQNMSLA